VASLEQSREALASVFAGVDALTAEVLVGDREDVLEHAKPTFQGGKGQIQQLPEQHRDEVGAFVDLFAAGLGLVLVGGEVVDQLADAVEQEDEFVLEEPVVGCFAVFVEEVLERPGVQGALARKGENFLRGIRGWRK